MIGGSSVQVRVVVFLEFSITQSHSGREVLVVDLLSDVLGFLHRIHQGSAHDLVLTDSDDRRWRLSVHFQHGANSLNTLKSGEPAIISAGSTTTLGVTQDGGSGIQTQALCEDVFDSRARDLVELAVLRSLGDNDDRATLASFFAVL